jgi:hypothetical protein
LTGVAYRDPDDEAAAAVAIPVRMVRLKIDTKMRWVMHLLYPSVRAASTLDYSGGIPD